MIHIFSLLLFSHHKQQQIFIMTKIVVIGKGEFGNSLAQGLETATVPTSNDTLSVEQISATKFFSMAAEDMSQILANVSYVMYCGRELSENAPLMAAALQGARSISSSSGKAPLLHFIDWSNPDPQSESYDGTVTVASALESTPDQIVWKVTGLSSYDVSGHTVSISHGLIFRHLHFLIQFQLHS
jgi:hypothetical protein